MKGPLLFFTLSTGYVLAQSPIVPVLKTRIRDYDEVLGESARTVDLTTYFGTEEIRDEAVRLTATYDLDGTIITSNFDFLLFKNLAPITVANLLGYVDRGDYTNMMIHRTAANFVIQGGGFTVLEDGNGGVVFESVPTQDPIVNEFNVSNTLSTLSMAKLGGDPDSATSQWFVNTAANSDNLDVQNGGFTVFGRISKSTLSNAITVNSPDKFLAANFGGATTAVPLEIGSSPQTLNIDDFFRFDSAMRIPIPAGEAGTSTDLTYRILSETGSNAISAEIDGTDLNVTYDSPLDGGAKTFVIEIEDSVGNTTVDTFDVTLPDQTYEVWRGRFFSEPELSDDLISGSAADPDGDGVTNLQLFAHGFPVDAKFPTLANQAVRLSESLFQISFPTRKNIAGISFDLEMSIDLENWTETSSASSTSDGTTTLTVSQNETDFPAAFYRIRVTLE
ncbi:MAG: peptidylprolyl isomerase [Akkermansiaceae bacterium]